MKKLFTILLLIHALVAFAVVQDVAPGIYTPGYWSQTNYIKNPFCFANTNDISTTGSAAVATTTTTPLMGTKACSITGTALADKVKFATRTLDNALNGQDCEVRFYYSGVATKWKAYVEQGVSNTKVSPDIVYNQGTGLADTGSNSSYAGTIFPCGTNANATRLVFETNATSALATQVSKVYIGPVLNTVAGITTTPDTAISSPASLFNNLGTVTVNFCSYYRVGSYMNGTCNFTTGTVVNALQSFTLPNSLHIDSNKVNNNTTSNTGSIVGTWSQNIGTSAIHHALTAPATDSTKIYMGYPAINSGANPYLIPTSNVLSSTTVSALRFSVPILEWAGDTNAFSTRCDDPRQCETLFTASVATTNAISNQNTGSAYPWLASCTISNTSHFVCPFNSSAGFTVTPNCWVQIKNSTSGTLIDSWFLDQSNTTSSQVSFDLFEGGARALNNVTVSCQKQGVDYSNSKVTQQIMQMRDVQSIPGTGRPVKYTANIGPGGTVTSNRGSLINGNCTNANPSVCTFNSGKFSTLDFCEVSVVNGGNRYAYTSSATTSGVSINELTVTTNTAVAIDTGVVLKCEGQL